MPRAVARRRPGRSSGQSRGPARSRRPLRAESVDGPSDSLLPPLSGSGTGMGSTAFYLVVLVCETFRMPVVTMSEMVAALRATVGKRGMPEEDLRALADYLMSFFGFETEAIDNNLDVADRDVFYMLEEEGLRQATTAEDGWRCVRGVQHVARRHLDAAIASEID